jgi:hypothetical protein
MPGEDHRKGRGGQAPKKSVDVKENKPSRPESSTVASPKYETCSSHQMKEFKQEEVQARQSKTSRTAAFREGGRGKGGKGNQSRDSHGKGGRGKGGQKRDREEPVEAEGSAEADQLLDPTPYDPVTGLAESESRMCPDAEMCKRTCHMHKLIYKPPALDGAARRLAEVAARDRAKALAVAGIVENRGPKKFELRWFGCKVGSASCNMSKHGHCPFDKCCHEPAGFSMLPDEDQDEDEGEDDWISERENIRPDELEVYTTTVLPRTTSKPPEKEAQLHAAPPSPVLDSRNGEIEHEAEHQTEDNIEKDKSDDRDDDSASSETDSETSNECETPVVPSKLPKMPFNLTRHTCEPGSRDACDCYKEQNLKYNDERRLAAVKDETKPLVKAAAKSRKGKEKEIHNWVKTLTVESAAFYLDGHNASHPYKRTDNLIKKVFNHHARLVHKVEVTAQLGDLASRIWTREEEEPAAPVETTKVPNRIGATEDYFTGRKQITQFLKDYALKEGEQYPYGVECLLTTVHDRHIYTGGKTVEAEGFLEGIVTKVLASLAKIGLLTEEATTILNKDAAGVHTEINVAVENKRLSYRTFFQRQGTDTLLHKPQGKTVNYLMMKYQLVETVPIFVEMYNLLDMNQAMGSRKKTDGDGVVFASMYTAAEQVLLKEEYEGVRALWYRQPVVFVNTMIHYLNQCDVRGNRFEAGRKPLDPKGTLPTTAGALAKLSATGESSGKGK